MDYPSTGVLIVNGLIAAAAILGVLSVWASRVGHVCDLHDLKVECDTLRHHYAERLRAMRADHDDEEPIDAEVVGRVSEEEAQRMAA
ncbi:MAG: hypothetical protein KDA30_06600 [Phycisphaerales bacterium]|nr:hypothetical protein [Phycisphaerales bacterium]